MVPLLTTVALLTAGAAFAGLHGSNWYSDENYVRANGRSQIASYPKWCSKLSGELKCKDKPEHKPENYRVECDRNRRVCEVVIAMILPSGEPWLLKHGYQITQWNYQRVSAAFTDSPHPCVVRTMEIDLDSKEVFLIETYKVTPTAYRKILGARRPISWKITETARAQLKSDFNSDPPGPLVRSNLVGRSLISRGLSQESLAHECGINRTYLSAIERSERNISFRQHFPHREGVESRAVAAIEG